MEKKKPGVDIINDLLEECIMAYPVSSFIISIYKRYQQVGYLSKKQLQGLYSKASMIQDIPTGKLATLEAVIKKMPTRYKSELPPPAPLFLCIRSRRSVRTGFCCLNRVFLVCLLACYVEFVFLILID